jgi:hypothetical protein
MIGTLWTWPISWNERFLTLRPTLVLRTCHQFAGHNGCVGSCVWGANFSSCLTGIMIFYEYLITIHILTNKIYWSWVKLILISDYGLLTLTSSNRREYPREDLAPKERQRFGIPMQICTVSQSTNHILNTAWISFKRGHPKNLLTDLRGNLGIFLLIAVEQWFSTFVKPRSSNFFFFNKTRARPARCPAVEKHCCRVFRIEDSPLNNYCYFGKKKLMYFVLFILLFTFWKKKKTRLMTSSCCLCVLFVCAPPPPQSTFWMPEPFMKLSP